MSCAVIRTWFPARRTDPSSTVRTFSCSPMRRRFSFFPLNENDDIRPATRNSATCVSALRISSVMPSAKNSFSASALRFANGSTAIDFCGAADACAVSGAANAAANSLPLSNRSVANRSSARCTARATGRGTPGRSAVTLAGVCTKRFAITACTVAPVNGGAPTSISYSTQPRL